MVKRIALDPSPGERESVEHIAQQLSALSETPGVVYADANSLNPGDLLITSDARQASLAASHGAASWTVRRGTGELEAWEDLPLAIAFSNGTLEDLRLCLETRGELSGEQISYLSWTPQGDVMGRTASGAEFYAVAGPDGENPQVFVGAEAQARNKDSAAFLATLAANEQVSASGAPAAGQTHSLTDGGGHRPVLRRHRFSLLPE